MWNDLSAVRDHPAGELWLQPRLPHLQSGALNSTRQNPQSGPGHNCTSWLAAVWEKPCLMSTGGCSIVSGRRSHLNLFSHCQASALDQEMGEVWWVRIVWFPDKCFPSKPAKVTFHLKNWVIHSKTKHGEMSWDTEALEANVGKI